MTEASPKPIDLSYVPSDAMLVVAVRPVSIVKSGVGTLVAKLANAEPIKFETTLGLPISEVESVKFVVNDVHKRVPFSRIVVRAAKPHDWTKFAAAIVPHPVAVESTQTVLAGKRVFKSDPGKSDKTTADGSSLCYWLPDDRTVVFAPEQEMPIMIAATANSEPEPKWAKTWEWATTRNLAVMVDVERLRKLIESDTKQGASGIEAAIVSTIGPVLEDSRRLFVVADLADNKFDLSALAECPSEDAAGRIELARQSLTAAAQNALSEIRKNGMAGSADAVPTKEVLLQAGDELLKAAKVKRSGNTVVLKTGGTSVTTKAIVILVLPAIQVWRNATRRARNLNRDADGG